MAQKSLSVPSYMNRIEQVSIIEMEDGHHKFNKLTGTKQHHACSQKVVGESNEDALFDLVRETSFFFRSIKKNIYI